MTGIKTDTSPQKGSAEGRRLRNLEIIRALQESNDTPHRQGKARTHTIVWVSSGEEDGGNDDIGDDTDEEDLVEQLQELSVKRPEPKQENLAMASHGASSSRVVVPTTPVATPPRYTAFATPPSHHASSRPLMSTPSTAPPPAHPVSPPPTPAPVTPGRQGKFNAYVVYSGATPHFYANWSTVKRMQQADPTLVFKGFYTLEKARQAWLAARNSGVIAAIQNGTGRTHWCVTEGVNPAIYDSLHEAIKVGLEWGGGCLKGWNNKADAVEDWNEKAGASPSRIIDTPSPDFFSM
ncbi:hypothetical protein BDP27DRAFT_1421563 [Rhodocollybia butyracea]|uniref:Ribonuclease H1 N-terminal domain-containing protein n=1 Tax=Rhodocollybia butyracea TaxID=206335 RepID=A0A9P5U8A4_9AGAR|nr:hypothetical protein BDP27DRAFT_1421563 [Rhodocollybia butyracea]